MRNHPENPGNHKKSIFFATPVYRDFVKRLQKTSKKWKNDFFGLFHTFFDHLHSCFRFFQKIEKVYLRVSSDGKRHHFCKNPCFLHPYTLVSTLFSFFWFFLRCKIWFANFNKFHVFYRFLQFFRTLLHSTLVGWESENCSKPEKTKTRKVGHAKIIAFEAKSVVLAPYYKGTGWVVTPKPIETPSNTPTTTGCTLWSLPLSHTHYTHISTK